MLLSLVDVDGIPSDVKRADIVIFGPLIDDPTTFSHAFLKQMHHTALELGYRSYFYNVRSVYPVLKSIMAAHHPRMILYGGHGFPHKWAGWILTYKLVSADDVKDGMFHRTLLVSMPVCFSAQNFGYIAVTKGKAPAFLGSTKLMFRSLNDSQRDYEKDFQQHYASLIIPLFQGQTVGQAYENYRRFGMTLLKEYESMVRKYGFHRTNADMFHLYLRKNIEGYKIIGNPDVRLTDL